MRKYVFTVFTVFTVFAIIGALLIPSDAWAASTVNVKMWDMGFTLDRDTVAAGKVTFKGTNTSTGTVHEMLVVKVETKLPNLPYNEDTGLVPEDKINSLGEIEEVEAGKKGELTIDMKPGIYLLFCNRPGHFAAGMKTLFFVK